ncbi:TonB-dependent receptor [Crenothrix sp.]|uniref:TonB-dependent receptor n=1 Tax=Crenothrix sp. TaxID=3100433 RepID=UPI00374C8D9A
MKKWVCLAFGLLGLISRTGIAATEQTPVDLGEVEVVGITPIPGSFISAEKIPANTQTISSKQLQKAQTISLADYMNRYLGSVHVNEAQNNPLQPDISYRGFVASPLMGLPQGLSTYVNGVRFNEPFGDTVNWDLIPQGAIDTMALFPGSNPVYGLNTLGGAISIRTKTGFSAPGHQLEVYGGSWDRHSEELTSGWNNGTWGYFLDVHNFAENGWRNFSPSTAKQILGTLSWQNDKGNLDLTVAANDNDLRGNGPAPVQLLAQNRKAIFTQYDQTITRMFFSELAGSYALSDNIELSGNAYFRQNRVHTFNGDNSDYSECPEQPGFICDDDNNRLQDANGNDIASKNLVTGNPPGIIGATNNTSATQMRSQGGTLQTVFNQALFGHENTLTVGSNYDFSNVHYGADTELGTLTKTRGTTQNGIFVDESKVRLHTNTSTVGVYLTDSFSITDKLTATIGGRYNYSHISMADKYISQYSGDPKKNLNGSHTFERLNPSAGLTYQVLKNLGVYGSYSESTRMPTPMELSCADPEDMCKLPNAFLSDPPLDQVVAKTWEAGIRGDLNRFIPNQGDLKWNLGFFHTINHNDIIFRHDASRSNILSEGYFDNVGKARRYGIETGATANMPQLFTAIDWHFSSNYTYLNARFQDGFDNPNPLDPEKNTPVNSGDRIPGIPEHIFKASIGVDLWKKLSLGINGTYSGGRVFRGDESNITPKLGGYLLFNATAEYKLNKHFALFGKLDNIFDTHYNSFGVYGQAQAVLGSAYNDGRFVSPGAPRAGWIGIRLNI